MRISTSMIYDAGVASINQQTVDLLKIQQQLATGRRVVTPADDPVAAAQSLQVQQSKDINGQFATNITSVNSALGLEESQLSSANGLLQRVQQLAVQAGNSTLSATDRKAISAELRVRFDDLMNLANATDGSGQFLFSGYMGSTKPFGGSIDAMIAGGGDIGYSGDSGQRTLGISPSTQVAVSDAGNDVFMRIPSGNGYFMTNYSATNTGTGVIDAGNVTNPAAWNGTANKPLTVSFTVAAGVTSYTVVDSAAPVPNTLAAGPYVAGQPIALAAQGISVTVSGVPANGDSFTIQASTSKSVFRSLADLVAALERSGGSPPANAKYQVDIGNALQNLQQASDNISRVRAGVGARLNQAESQESLNSDLNLQYAQTLSSLQDVDYAKAITDLTQKQTQLEAAQKSFAALTKLSLFNYL